MRCERDLSFDERIRWGICSVCDAPDGEPCRAEVGLNLGMTASGRHLQTGEGAHLARLSAAPVRVATLDVRELKEGRSHGGRQRDR